MPRGPTDVDRILGERLRALRIFSNVSQEALAAQVNITFQQIQKYESGANRISASRLVQLSNALGVAPGYLLAGLSAPGGSSGPASLRRAASDAACLKLVDMFSSIESKAVRTKVLHLVEALAKGAD
jgi:transcriptional regulator with XRE-family HTH domain